MLLRGLSFLKDRGNIREKTGKGRQGVSHNLHALLCGTGRYCPSSRKARASICSQERKLNQAGVTSLPALAHGEHREGVNASGRSRPCLVLEEEDVSAVHGCVGRAAGRGLSRGGHSVSRCVFSLPGHQLSIGFEHGKHELLHNPILCHVSPIIIPANKVAATPPELGDGLARGSRELCRPPAGLPRCAWKEDVASLPRPFLTSRRTTADRIPN